MLMKVLAHNIMYSSILEACRTPPVFTPPQLSRWLTAAAATRTTAGTACAAPAQPLLSTQFFQAAFSVSQSAPPSQLLYMLLMESWTPAGQVVVLSRARERATTPLSRPQVSPAPLYASSLELILGGHASRTAS